MPTVWKKYSKIFSRFSFRCNPREKHSDLNSICVADIPTAMGGVTRDVRSGAMWSGREREALYSKSKLARWCSIAMQRAVRTPGVAGLGLVRFQGGATLSSVGIIWRSISVH